MPSVSCDFCWNQLLNFLISRFNWFVRFWFIFFPRSLSSKSSNVKPNGNSPKEIEPLTAASASTTKRKNSAMSFSPTRARPCCMVCSNTLPSSCSSVEGFRLRCEREERPDGRTCPEPRVTSEAKRFGHFAACATSVTRKLMQSLKAQNSDSTSHGFFRRKPSVPVAILASGRRGPHSPLRTNPHPTRPVPIRCPDHRGLQVSGRRMD